MADLARKAKCSARTIENVERGGKRVYAITLSEIAEALEVDFTALLDAPAESRPAPPAVTQERRVPKVNVHFTFDFENIDASDQLIELMEKLAATVGATAEIRVLSVTEGSLIVTLDMSEEDALKLVSAFNQAISSAGEGKLDSLGISKISFPASPVMLRVAEAFSDVQPSDVTGISYEESHLHELGLKPVWYLLKIAQFENAKVTARTVAPSGEVNFSSADSRFAYREERRARMRAQEHREIAEAAYALLKTDPDMQDLMPDAEEIFAARILLNFITERSPILRKPKVSSRGRLQIARRPPKSPRSKFANPS